ncbi:P450 putative-RELATED [Salix purpurea]|uniref:P450 putative-RELATED n=1 Tax=Salix purpurea TaxID=77065 RepID=A0A9Q0VB25_SALPP|nr:P450 putative-RELATED [Salix purpurea]
MASPLIYFSICLFLSILIILVKFLNKVWWTPVRIQSLMKSQGIEGPSYRFLHGNTKEISSMIRKIRSSPQELLHHTLPMVHPHFHSWIKIYGMNFLQWYGPQAQLIITEPELVKKILSNKDRAYPKTKVSSEIKKLLGDGIVLSEGEKWGMVPEMITSLEIMLERWRHYHGKEIDIFSEFKILTSEVISRTSFGSSYLEGQHVFDMLTRMTHIISENNYRVRIPGIGKFVKASYDIEFENLEAKIRESFMNMMKKREKDAMFGRTRWCKNFYLAGQETSASALTWIVFLLSVHTDWQDKARKEVLELFGQQIPSQDRIAKLRIMGMVINESLRLYTPNAILMRRVERETRLGKITVPANTEVYISTLAVHQNPEIWGEDALLFQPERFADGVVKATNSNIAAFLPFGLGPRNCAGMNFAITETKLALSMILQHYSFTLSPTYAHCPTEVLTMCPQHGVQVILQPYQPDLL